MKRASGKGRFKGELKKCETCSWRNGDMCYHPAYAEPCTDLYGGPCIMPAPITKVAYECQYYEPYESGAYGWFEWATLPIEERLKLIREGGVAEWLRQRRAKP